MKRNFPIWLILMVIFIAGYLTYSIFSQPANQAKQSNQEQPNQDQSTKEQPTPVDKSQVQAAPDFTLTDLDGQNISLSDFQGKNVYINFWASWCGPCKLEMPDIEKIHQDYKDKDLVVLAVNIGESQDKVKTFMNANSLSFPVLLDSQGKTAKTYKVSSIPVSLFVNKEGLIVGKQVGLMTHSQMEAYVADLYK